MSGRGAVPAPPVHARSTDSGSGQFEGGATVRIVFALLAVLLSEYLVSVWVRGQGESSRWLDSWSVAVFELASSGLCLARAIGRPGRRALPLTLGLALTLWSLGDIALAVEPAGRATAGAPSVADIFYLGFYPFAYGALGLLMRDESRSRSATVWLDGAIAGLGTAAAGTAFALQRIMDSSHGSSVAGALTSYAYPAGDLVLLCLIVGGSVLRPTRRRVEWAVLGTALAVNVVGDTANLLQASFGSTHLGDLANRVAWPLSILLLAAAVWLRTPPSDLKALPRPNSFAIPAGGAVGGLAVLLVGNLQQTNRAAMSLATATLVLVGARLVVSVRSIRALSQERSTQSMTDELTGLGNRRRLQALLDKYFQECDAGTGASRSLAFLFLDLDHFKEINDTFGHSAGDKLLKQLGPRLGSCLREVDLLVRLGGDEFAIVLVDCAVEYAHTVARTLSTAVAAPFVLDTVNASIGASIGIAHAPTDASDASMLMRCADLAMYRAKATGVCFASYESDTDLLGNRLRLSEELREALEANQLLVQYQPQIDLRTEEIIGVEALLRWPHPTLGIVPPLDFLPLAEEAGLMCAVTTMVLDTALGECANWWAEGNGITVSVNVSASNLRDPRLVGLVESLLSKHGLPAEALVLEITETSVIEDFEHCQGVIRELALRGVTVSIDDFGAGFTSLAYLSGLDVRELKLDRSFVLGLTSGDVGRGPALVRAVINLGHALGLTVVAEGIEDRETLDLLSELGCDIAQGNYIGRPGRAHALAPRLVPFSAGLGEHGPAALQGASSPT